MIKSTLIGVTIGIFGCANVALAQEEQVRTFGQGHEILVVSDVELGPKQQAEFDVFVDYELSYFGAFYINTEVDDAIFDFGANGLEAVEKFVKLICEFHPQGVEQTCEPYAYVLPIGVYPGDPDLKGVSERNLEEVYNTFDQVQVQGKYGAMAVSPLYSAASVGDFRNKSDARRNAVTACRDSQLKQFATFYQSILSQMRKLKIWDCEVIKVYEGG